MVYAGPVLRQMSEPCSTGIDLCSIMCLIQRLDPSLKFCPRLSLFSLISSDCKESMPLPELQLSKTLAVSQQLLSSGLRFGDHSFCELQTVFSKCT